MRVCNIINQRQANGNKCGKTREPKSQLIFVRHLIGLRWLHDFQNQSQKTLANQMRTCLKHRKITLIHVKKANC